MQLTRLKESENYRQLREQLRVAELELTDHVERVVSKGAQLADDRRERGIDLLSPVWHLLDLTPAGRDDWYPSLDY